MAVASSYGPQGSETGMLLLERAFKPDGTKTGIVWCHGFTAPSADVGNPAYTAAGRVFCEAGYPVIGTDMGGLSTWGIDAALNALANAISRLSAIGAKTSKVVLCGISMGALTVLNAVTRGKIAASQIAAILIQDPIIYLQNVHASNRGGFASSIETAYGGASAFAAAMPAYDPSAHPAAFTGIPMKLYAGDADTIALSTEAQTFAANVGSSCQVEVIAGGTHSTVPTSITANDVMAFLRPYL